MARNRITAALTRTAVAAVLVFSAWRAAAQSSRPGWGATPYAGSSGTGVTFRVWAPNASNVTVAGTFNGWNMSANPLVIESVTSGVWSADAAGARPAQSYKYVINASLWRSDPQSRAIDASNNDNSIIVDTNSFNWNGDSFSVTNSRDLVLYEAHVGTFVGLLGTFSTFTNKLDYLRDLGVSGVELMPINQFPSTTSWGYNPAYPFAVEYSYGTPDTLKQLVLNSHQHGVAMLLDVVHNHWDGDSSLWQFDGWVPDPVYGGLYFYNTAPYGFTPWGPRPDYAVPQVCDFINNTFRMWLGEYHFSGFRWDAPSYIIYTTNGVYIPEGQQMISNAINMMSAEYPGTLNIAEDIKELTAFNAYWDLSFCSDIRSVLTQSDDSNRDMPTVARDIGGPFQRVIFVESHDVVGDLNGGLRLPTAIYAADAAGYYARKRSTLGAALVMTSPGTPMIFEGEEMLETNQFSDTRAVDWTRTNTFAGIVRLYQDLIRLRRNLDGVSDGLMGDGCDTYDVDNANKLVAYSRWVPGTTGHYVVVVCNFANTTRTGYSINFPEEGTWYVQFNSDSTNYCSDYGNYGSTEVPAAGSPPSGTINIAPYSVLILSRIPRMGMLINSTTPVDQPAGNGDGILDPGETIQERIVLWNNSSMPASNVSAVLTCDTPGVTIEQGASVYPPMAAGGVATNAAMFAYSLDPSLACGSPLSFRLATIFNGQVLTNVFEHDVGKSVTQPPVTNEFDSTDVPKPIPDVSTVYSVLPVNVPGSNIISDVNVQLRINHTYDHDLTLAIQHPDGSEVILANRRGGSGQNYGTGACASAAYTVFDQNAALAISNAAAPFVGTFRPDGNLNTLNGKPLNGTWQLRVTDSYRRDTGTTLCWSITVAYQQHSYACNGYSNQPPIATGTNLVLVGFDPTNIALTGTDPGDRPLTFQTLTIPTHGLLSALDTSTWQTVYTPVRGFIGTDAFDFAAADGLNTSLPATVSIAVQAQSDTDGNGLPDYWEQLYFGSITGADPNADGDTDGVSNIQEYLAGTNPKDSNSVLRMCSMLTTSGWYVVDWDSVGGTRYRVEYDSGFDDAFTPILQSLAAEIDPSLAGTPSTMSFTDTFTLTPPLGTNSFRLYRVRVLNQ